MAVIASNGAAKSTMLAAVAGDLDAGHVSVGGRRLDSWPAHRRARVIARVFQDPMQGTASALTIEENFAITARRGHRRDLRPLGLGLVMGATLAATTAGARQARGAMTTLMITHNMDHAPQHGDRLLMMHEGRVILDVAGPNKARLTREELVARFHDAVSDRLLLQ